MSIKKKILIATLILLIIVTFIGVVHYFYEIITWKNNTEENNKIKEEIENNITINTYESEEETQEEKAVKYDIDFKKLKEKNKDTIGFLKVNNTNIEYVFVKGKNNNYYLNHNFDKKPNIAGWIFADYHNKFDGTDKNIVIYGHNVKDLSMFGSLKNVLSKDWYNNKDNQKIVVVTENGTYYYQVFSIYSIKPENYYINTEFKNNDEFYNFLRRIKSRSVYKSDVGISGEDKILTLSSCTNDGNKRIVLHAKLIESE